MQIFSPRFSAGLHPHAKPARGHGEPRFRGTVTTQAPYRLPVLNMISYLVPNRQSVDVLRELGLASEQGTQAIVISDDATLAKVLDLVHDSGPYSSFAGRARNVRLENKKNDMLAAEAVVMLLKNVPGDGNRDRLASTPRELSYSAYNDTLTVKVGNTESSGPNVSLTLMLVSNSAAETQVNQYAKLDNTSKVVIQHA